MVMISIIMPIYNAGQYLSQCLDSLLCQTLSDFEILCINDGSTDNTLTILEAYQKKDSRITVVTQKNAGAGVARNRGLKLAKGKYLAILDADDFFELDMLEKAYLQCEKDDADFCVFRSDEYDNTTQIYRESLGTIQQTYLPGNIPFSAKEAAPYIFQLFIGWSWDKLYNRDFIRKTHLKFQNLRTTNDAYFVFMANVQASKITVVDKVLAHHRTNVKTSLSLTREKSWNCCYIATMSIRRSLLWRRKYKMVEKSFVNWALNFLLWNAHTLQGEVREELIKVLYEDIFPKLKIGQYPQEYFYNQNDYKEYLKLQENMFK